MKRITIVAAVVLAGLLLFLGGVAWRIRSERPEALVEKLRHAGEGRERIAMRLNLVRGDPVTPMLQALQEEKQDTEFRMILVELLFKRHLRVAEDRIMEALNATLKDPDDEVRRAAATGFLTFAGEEEQAALVNDIEDDDPAIRLAAYTAFGRSRWRDDDSMPRIWRALSDEQRQHMLERCAAQAKTEEDPEASFMARSVVGRKIQWLCAEATDLLQKAEPVEAEARLMEALALDPENHRARIRLVRHHLTLGNKEKALELAEKYQAVLRIPLLSEAPVIDGDPTDKVWEEAFTSDRFYLTVSRYAGRLAEGKTRFHIGRQGSVIYVTVLGFEEDLGRLVVERTGRDTEVWRDDCCELFFDPGDTQKNVAQFIINAAGHVQDSRGGVERKYVTGFNVDFQSAAKIFHDRGYWAAEFAIDSRELEDDPITKDSLWGINIVRTRIGAGSEHCQWWPTFGQAHNFSYFPIAVFEVE